MITLMRLEWGADNPALRQMFAAKMMPDATKEQVVNFAMGALMASQFLRDANSLNSYGKVEEAIIAAATRLGGDLDAVENSIAVGASIQSVLRNMPNTGDPSAVFSANLTGMEAPYVAAYVCGAVGPVYAAAFPFASTTAN